MDGLNALPTVDAWLDAGQPVSAEGMPPFEVYMELRTKGWNDIIEYVLARYCPAGLLIQRSKEVH